MTKYRLSILGKVIYATELYPILSTFHSVISVAFTPVGFEPATIGIGESMFPWDHLGL